MGSSTPSPDFDVIIVGAGFSGLHILKDLLKSPEEVSVQVFEQGDDIGGTWHHNRYPGARVDSEGSFYQFSDPELYQDFQFSDNFPSRSEVLRYFRHVDTKLGLRRHIKFNETVTSAKFNDDTNLWQVTTTPSGLATNSRFLLLCIGFAARPFTPKWQGVVDAFKGQIYHTANWPKGQGQVVKYEDKRVAVIGTGASGVQVIQEIGPKAKHLTVYQRTPNLALPMNLAPAPKGAELVSQVMATRLTTFGGMSFDFSTRTYAEDTPAERLALYKSLWAMGGFHFWLGAYFEVFIDQEANDVVYSFWAEKTRARITNPAKKDLLAPLLPIHPFGTKRPSLEQNYFEVCDLPHVDIIDVNASPIIEFTGEGITTEKEGVKPFDIIIFATGFDSITGSYLNIDIRNGKGLSIGEKWASEEATKTAYGMALAEFPNMFFLYGPQAPTAFSNGPTCTEVQSNWVTPLVRNVLKEGKEKVVVATKEAEEEWSKGVHDIWNGTLFPLAKSWYQGANIPGKRVEPLNFAGGIPAYIQALKECEEGGYKGFIIT